MINLVVWMNNGFEFQFRHQTSAKIIHFEFESKRIDSFVTLRSLQYFCEHLRQVQNEMIKVKNI